MRSYFTIILGICYCIYASIGVINSSDGVEVFKTHKKQIELKKSFSIIYNGVHLRVNYDWDSDTYDVVTADGDYLIRGLEANLQLLEDKLSKIIPVKKDRYLGRS